MFAPFSPKAKAEARTKKSQRLRRALAMPTVLPVERWDLF